MKHTPNAMIAGFVVAGALLVVPATRSFVVSVAQSSLKAIRSHISPDLARVLQNLGYN